MASRRSDPLPPPLPPEERTVGQLIAESLRLYGRRLWVSLALGIGPAAAAVGGAALPREERVLFLVSAGAVLATASYVGGAILATGASPPRRSLLIAFAIGLLVIVPVPFLLNLVPLLSWLVAAAWLAAFGLGVPAALVERLGFVGSMQRGFDLARADYLHALGSVAALAIVAFVTASALFFALLGFGETAAGISAFVALLVISPVLFLGAGLLYVDQAARLDARKAA